MRVELTDKLKRYIQNSVSRPLEEKIRELETEQFTPQFSDALVEELLTPAQRQARRTLFTVPGVLSRNHSWSLTYGSRKLSANLVSPVVGAPNAPSLDTGDGPCVSELRARYGAADERRARLKLLTEELEQMFGQATTLQEIHAAWPGVLDHVSPEVSRRFERKLTPRTKRKPAELELSGESMMELAKLKLGAV